MANNSDNKKHYIIEALLSIVLIIVTGGGVYISNRMASLMEETNRAELRPYLYIKFLEQAYFKHCDVENIACSNLYADNPYLCLYHPLQQFSNKNAGGAGI